jgi:hypothetical protein
MATRWTIRVSEETDRSLRTYLGQHDARRGSLSQFVEEAVQERLYQLTVDEVRVRNANLSEDEVESIIEDAVQWARTAR